MIKWKLEALTNNPMIKTWKSEKKQTKSENQAGMNTASNETLTFRSLTILAGQLRHDSATSSVIPLLPLAWGRNKVQLLLEQPMLL